MSRGFGTIQRAKDQLDALMVGRLAGAGLLTTGEIFYVKHGSDADFKEFEDIVPLTHRDVTIAAALAKCQEGANDYVLVAPQDDLSAWAQTADVELDVNCLHLLGLSAGQIKPAITFSTAKSLVVGPNNTAALPNYGIEVGNLKITASGTTNVNCITIGATALGYVYDTWLHDLEVSTTATTAATAEIADYGSRLLAQRCRIGQATAAHPDDNYLQIAPTAPATYNQAATFEDCVFLHYAAATADQHATILANTNPAIFRRCLFYNGNYANFICAVGVVSAGLAILDNCGFVGSTIAGTTAKSWIIPAAQGNGVLAADIFNPGLAIDGAEPVGVDT